MMKKFTTPKIYSVLSFLALLLSVNAYAQPANDDCGMATDLSIAANENSISLVSATTLNATQSDAPAEVCSGSWFADDVWFSITTPATLSDDAIVVEIFFGDESGDLPAVGAAFYDDCTTSPARHCFSDASGDIDRIKLFPSNLEPSTTYYIRVWSGGSATDNSGSFRIGAYYEALADDVVLWGANPGEGDFDGGLNGWTVQSITGDTAMWRWEPDGRNNGSFRRTSISSPTTFNGAMVFDADSMNTVYGNPPGPPYPQLRGELISPTIDASTFNAVSLKFYHAYAPLNGNAYYSFSLDDGATWSADVEVDEPVAANSYAQVGDFERIFLPDLAGESQVRVKFSFDGDFYYWIIDDVTLIEPEDNNLVVMENFYAIAPNAMWPESQLEPFSFLADVANIGSAPQTNTVLNMTVTDAGSGATVYTEDLEYGTLAADSLYQNVPFAGTFEPTGAAGTVYNGVYTIMSDSVDFEPSNNTQAFTFMVSDTTFAKEQGITRTVQPGAGNWETEGEVHSWAYGNFFHIVNGSDASDPQNSWMASSGSFGIGNPENQIGTLVSLILYQWTDLNVDGNMDFDERTPVGTAVYEITDETVANELITLSLIPVPNGTPGEVLLTSGMNYALMLEYIASDETDLSMSAAEPWDYGAQTLRSNEADVPFRTGELLGINGDLSMEPYSSAGFTGTVVPAIRLNLAKIIFDDIAELDAANIINVTPNPADNYINLSVDLVNQQEMVQVQIMDIAGRVVMDRTHDNVINETFSYDVSNFAAGTYLVNFITEEGSRVERLIIQR